MWILDLTHIRILTLNFTAMKKIKKINLTSLSKRELDKRQMKVLKGGGYCLEARCNCGSISPADSTATNEWRIV
ncbi:MAG TPA: hypothetical protein DEQ30_00915 [Porphyromonadaceae bacterium]|nr:hypothetical protein [Porphyromonadaceae bacterium]